MLWAMPIALPMPALECLAEAGWRAVRPRIWKWFTARCACAIKGRRRGSQKLLSNHERHRKNDGANPHSASTTADASRHYKTGATAAHRGRCTGAPYVPVATPAIPRRQNRRQRGIQRAIP